ncbi:MAG: aminopeptidase P family protein [Ignavibacteriales bacterium]|nr:aminopeptidase P family protein [Ignavibacteriales bacterium]
MTRLLIILFVLTAAANGQDAVNPIPSLREQVRIHQEWLRTRVDSILPRIMREHGVQMWIIPMREYNEDPVFSSLVSLTTFAARRRTIYVFHDRGLALGVEKLALGGSSQGGVYIAYRDSSLGNNAELWGKEQWSLLAKVVRERDPETIAVNISHTHAFSDGLSAGEWEQLSEALGEYSIRIVRRERLALDFISLRIPEMLPTYREMMKAVHAIISTAFSSEVIVPGKTRTQDVVWWMRQRAHELGFSTWFHPTVDVQRVGTTPSQESDPVIERGDVLHCDFGITLMRLNTDTQHMGYVLRDGETDVPEGIKKTLAASNRLQDILLGQMKPGLTGNQILAKTLDQMRQEGINGTVYTHPIGEHGHGAGPLVGLWDRQHGVPGRGDVPLLPNTWYSIELQATTPVPEWNNQAVRSSQEEEAYVDSTGTVKWVLERQMKFHIVR